MQNYRKRKQELNFICAKNTWYPNAWGELSTMITFAKSRPSMLKSLMYFPFTQRQWSRNKRYLETKNPYYANYLVTHHQLQLAVFFSLNPLPRRIEQVENLVSIHLFRRGEQNDFKNGGHALQKLFEKGSCPSIHLQKK